MKQHQPFIKKTPASPAMEFCVQKMVFFASEGRMYQENILQRPYFREQRKLSPASV
jgi:hypothetical protein